MKHTPCPVAGEVSPGSVGSPSAAVSSFPDAGADTVRLLAALGRRGVEMVRFSGEDATPIFWLASEKDVPSTGLYLLY